MPDESNEQQRQIDDLRQQVVVLKAVAEEQKQTQEAERKVLKSDLAETLTRFEAEGAKAREADAKQRAAEREAAAKERAEDRLATEKLRTDMERRTGRQTALILAAIAVATGILGFWLQQGG